MNLRRMLQEMDILGGPRLGRLARRQPFDAARHVGVALQEFHIALRHVLHRLDIAGPRCRSKPWPPTTAKPAGT